MVLCAVVYLNTLELNSRRQFYIVSLFDFALQPDSMNVDDEISVEDKAGPVVTESSSSQSGACDWPSSSSLTARLRRLITAYQRSYRQEQLKIEAEAKGDRRRRRCEQASKLKEIARQERQQRYAGVASFYKVSVLTLQNTNISIQFTPLSEGFLNFSGCRNFLLQSQIEINSHLTPAYLCLFLGGHAERSVTSTVWYQLLAWKR